MSAIEVLFLIAVLGFVIGGIDDLVFDVVYWIESGRRDRGLPVLREEELAEQPQLRAAIIVGAWKEHDVIERMILHNHELIRYRNYSFFIGTYPNDLPTQAAVDRLCAQLPKAHKSVTPHPGPTNKADNLNWILAEIVREEERSGRRFDFVVMHDPEDVLHPLELQVLNWHLQRNPRVRMIQTPIYPLPVRLRDLTGGTYMDEFAEIHSKDLLVRGWVDGFIPSAGVATTLRREVLDDLARRSGTGRVFSTDSLTEDYDLGLKLRLHDLKATFVRQFVDRPRHALTPNAIQPGRPDGVPGPADPGRALELVATRAEFPHTFGTSVRQRTRWTVGIVFQAWRKRGWVGSPPVLWLLFHDRKGPWAYTVVLLGYLVLAWVTVHELLRGLFFPEWTAALPPKPLIGVGITLGVALLAQRLLQRAVATTRIYGPLHGMMSMVRLPWSNLINVSACYRATIQFFTALREGAVLVWDKTQHYVPVVAGAARKKLGEILLSTDHVTGPQLNRALAAQRVKGGRIGDILLRHGSITKANLGAALSEQGEALDGPTSAGHRRRLGRVLLENRAVSPLRLVDALAEQRLLGGRLGEILMARRWITEADLMRALRDQGRPLGELLVRMGRLTQAQVDRAVAAQEQEGRRLGEVLLGWGWIHRADLIDVLHQQGNLGHDAARRAIAGAALGESLLARGHLMEEQVARALSAQRREKSQFGDIVVERGWVSAEAVAEALYEQRRARGER